MRSRRAAPWPDSRDPPLALANLSPPLVNTPNLPTNIIPTSIA